MMQMQNRNRKYAEKVILCAVVMACTFAVVMRDHWLDYSVHVGYAINFRKEFLKLFTSISEFQFQYPMWHFLVNLFYKLRFIFTDLTPQAAAAFVTAGINGCVYLIFDKILSCYGVLDSAWAAFGLCFVMPVYHPWSMDKRFYFGQGSPVVWHNPSTIMVKPFALIGFFQIKRILDNIGKQETDRKEYLSLSAVIFLSVLAKPSFFQGIVPALGVYILIRLIRTKFANFREYCLLCACFIPGFLLVLFQSVTTFFVGEEGGGISFGWLDVAKFYYPRPWEQFFLTLAFPLGYILFNLKKAFKHTEIQLSVLFLLCSWLQYAVLYENGIRRLDGNFEWALCLAYTVIWLVTSSFFFKDWQEMDLRNKREKAVNTVLLLTWAAHFVSGIYFLGRLLKLF